MGCLLGIKMDKIIFNFKYCRKPQHFFAVVFVYNLTLLKYNDDYTRKRNTGSPPYF
jgi:hypothetical protein